MLLAACNDYEAAEYITGYRVLLGIVALIVGLTLSVVYSSLFVFIFLSFLVLLVSFKTDSNGNTPVLRAIVARLKDQLFRLGILKQW